ncbi:helix-turn-helix transcriptional regulator [Salipaludibacillus sp. HK11]|uniref:helix-turn-helix transcriptional regulator n=1 Tax=Salipaludibacillus sp. HK11 TaxID=3394320 RepID=UPI0039FD6C8C
MGSVDIFNDLSEHVSLQIHSCQRNHHNGDWAETKVHNDYDLWLIESGQITLKTGNTIATGKKGDLVFFYPQAPYTASTTQEGCKFIFVHFDFGIGNHFRILNDFKLSGIIPGKIVYDESVLFQRSFEQYDRNTSMSQLRLKSCFTLLVTKIIEKYGDGEYKGEFLDGLPHEREQTKNLYLLNPVFNYIHENIHKSLKICQLARIAGVSEKYFITFFKKSVGMTPGKYMNQLKMNKARDYLYQRRYAVNEIAELLGYPDLYTFSKAFKKYYKVSPTKFL